MQDTITCRRMNRISGSLSWYIFCIIGRQDQFHSFTLCMCTAFGDRFVTCVARKDNEPCTLFHYRPLCSVRDHFPSEFLFLCCHHCRVLVRAKRQCSGHLWIKACLLNHRETRHTCISRNSESYFKAIEIKGSTSCRAFYQNNKQNKQKENYNQGSLYVVPPGKLPREVLPPVA